MNKSSVRDSEPIDEKEAVASSGVAIDPHRLAELGTGQDCAISKVGGGDAHATPPG